MFEYLFFSDGPCRRFVGWLEERNIPVCMRDNREGKTVGVPEDLEEALLDDVDAFYERMVVRDESMLNEGDDAAGRHTAGITLNLSNGLTPQVAVPPELLNRLLSVMTLEELGQFVQRIVNAVENPDSRPFCQQFQNTE